MDTSITKNGKITVYGFHCGYVEEHDGKFRGVRLWLEGCWHVREHYNADSGRQGYNRHSWDSFETLTEARREYQKRVRSIELEDEHTRDYNNNTKEQ